MLSHKECGKTTYKKKGKNTWSDECPRSYVTICCDPDSQYCSLPTFLLIGNSAETNIPTDKIIDESEVESSSTNIGDSSKSVYVNDSFNLDTIPFGCEAIMEEMSDEEI
jgi:hypothetical protein